MTSLEEKIKQSWKNTTIEDEYLFYNGVHENSISHKFAEKMNIEINDICKEGKYNRNILKFHVDCEYNRNNEDVKSISIPDTTKDLPPIYKNIRPDIIIHRRGEDQSNEYCFELKRVSYYNFLNIEKITSNTMKFLENENSNNFIDGKLKSNLKQNICYVGDFRKLKFLTSQSDRPEITNFHYKIGYFVIFHVKNEKICSSFIVFKNGNFENIISIEKF